MRTFIKIYLLSLTLEVFVASGCNSDSKKNKENNIPNINQNYFKILKESVKLSELFSKYEFITLKKNREDKIELFGEISKLLISKDRIIVFDKEITNRLFVYNNSGGFIFTIKMGEGPHEVRKIEDICLGGEDNILVLDNGSKSIKSFSLNDGSFIRSRILYDFHDGIELIDNEKVILKNTGITARSKYDGNGLVYYSLNNSHIEDKTLPIKFKRYQDLVGGKNPFIQSDTSIYFSTSYNNEIYIINKEKETLSKKITIDFGEDDITRFAANIESNQDLSKLSVKSSYLTGFSGNSKDNVIYLVSKTGELQYLFVNKKTNNSIAYKNIENDLFGVPIITFIGSSSGDAAYTFLPVETMVNMMSRNLIKNPILRKILDNDYNIMNSNPILVKLTN